MRAPTLILNMCGTPASAGASEVAASVHGPISRGGLSYPLVGKHIVFDGSRLHGAVPYHGGEAPRGQRRITFLVNLDTADRTTTPHTAGSLALERPTD